MSKHNAELNTDGRWQPPHLFWPSRFRPFVPLEATPPVTAEVRRRTRADSYRLVRLTRGVRYLAVAIAAVLWLSVKHALAHDLAMDQIILMPDVAHGVLRGQIIFNPHRTRAVGAPITPEIGRKVLALVAGAIKLELDGKPLKMTLEVRELWVRGGPTLGDSIMVHAVLPRKVRELRVFADASLNALIVTVQVPAAAGTPQSQTVLVQGGHFTPTYHFDPVPSEWQLGGPSLFEVEPSDPVDVSQSPSNVVTARSPLLAPTATTATVFGLQHARSGFEEVGPLAEIRRYLFLGFHHILPLGWDHVLFVSGLVLGSRLRLRSLLWQLSAFTFAHTVTLALGALGWVVLAPGVVEPLIAFSIAYVALENLVLKYNARRRVLLAFGFGLLHGQGFASALIGTGLPHGAFLLALVSFNAGVELGQLVTVLVLVIGLLLLERRGSIGPYILRPSSAAIAVTGLCWGFIRLLG